MATPTTFFNIFATTEGMETHKSEGGRNVMHGFYYQISLIMLWILRSLKSKFKFKISTEDVRLGKFDDFALYKMKDGQVQSQIFVQIKHSKVDRKITFTDLFKGKLDLNDFFKSFSDKTKVFSDIVDTKLVLYTNRDFEYGSKLGNVVLNKNMFDIVHDDQLFNSNMLKFRCKFEGRDEIIQKFLKTNKCDVSDVNDFLDKFYIVVNGEQIESLQEKITHELKYKLNSVFEGTAYYNQYYNDIQHWYQSNSETGTVICSESVEEYLLSLRDRNKKNFRLLSPNSNFHGRTKELQEMQNILTSSDNRELIDIVVSGTAGVGKSEVARKCALTLNDKFQHVIWLNAESEETLRSSYMKLAEYFAIPVNFESEEENGEHKKDSSSIKSIVRKINDFLRNRKCLFIFDNAETYLMKQFKQYIQTLNPNHRTILTSQLQDWPCMCPIILDVFCKDEAVQFLQQNLSFEDKDCKILEEIAAMLSYLPVALQLAVAYVSKTAKRKKLMGKIYSIKDFQAEYQECSGKFLQLEISDARPLDNYTKSLYLAWQLSVDSILAETNGDKAIEILQIMSFLDPDNIHIFMLQHLCASENILENVIEVLHSYSLIKCESGVCSIHRLLQDVIRAKIEQDSTGVNDSLAINSIARKAIMYVCISRFRYSHASIIASHVLYLWNIISGNINLTNWFFILDEKYDSTSCLDKRSLQSLNIYIAKLSYLATRLASRNADVSRSILDALTASYEITLHCRNFSDAITLFNTYLNKLSFLIIDNKDLFLDLLLAYSYCQFQVQNYDKSISLHDDVIKYLRKTLPYHYQYIFKAHRNKAEALVWQYRYKEALDVLIALLKESSALQFKENVVNYFEYQHRASGMTGITFGEESTTVVVGTVENNPWDSNEDRASYVNLMYIVRGPDRCHKLLRSFLPYQSSF